MRDMVLVALLPFLVYFAFKRPFIGLALWLWSSTVPVQEWTFGFATSIRWNFMFALITIISFTVSNQKAKFNLNNTQVLLFLFTINATFAAVFHIGNHGHVWQEWEYLFKSIVFLTFVNLIVKKKIHFDALVWACALSISTRAAEDGIKVIASGGSHVIQGITSTFSDNNLSALAVLIVIPLLYYLYTQYKEYRILKFGIIGLLASNTLFVLGSNSRGALLGLLAIMGVAFLKSDKKGLFMVIAVIGGIAGLSLMDAEWFDRMNSIKDADQDASFMGRVVSWKLAIIMAMERPFLGGGFDATSYPPTWLYLTSHFDKLSFIPTPDPKTIHVAHSIYFQVLGDIGLFALILYLMIFTQTVLKLRKYETDITQPDWLRTLSLMLRMSVLAFLVSGAALSSAYNEIILMVIGLSIAAERYIKEHPTKDNKNNEPK